jgi:hypothetical protein
VRSQYSTSMGFAERANTRDDLSRTLHACLLASMASAIVVEVVVELAVWLPMSAQLLALLGSA